MQRILFLCILLLAAVGFIPVHAEDSPPAMPTGRAAVGLWLHTGPHPTYPQETGIWEGALLRIEGRNRAGNWLYVVDSADTSRTGWMQTGFISSAELRLSAVPVLDTADANPQYFTDAETDDLRLLYSTPVLAPVDPAIRDVFLRGQQLGRAANSVARIGDCNSASELYLTPFAAARFDLGPYDFLSETVLFFSASFARSSVAARDGFNTLSIFDPMWAIDPACEGGETPLACAYRSSSAAFATVVFGQNDIYALNREQFEDQLRTIITFSFDQGVIPVLGTFTNNPDNTEAWGQVLAFNAIIVRVAAEYRVPLVNFWLAARALPDYGIAADYAHLTTGGEIVRFTGDEAQHGMTLYNLLMLGALDALRREVIAGMP